MVFCSKCGKEAEHSTAKYCSKCGSTLVTAGVSTTTSNDESTSCGGSNSNNGKTMNNLKQFLSLKGKERTGFFTTKKDKEEPSKKKAKFFSKTRKDITKKININVGLMKFHGGSLSVLRGSKIPVQVSRSDNVGEVLNAAVTKYTNHDQFFCGAESYVLMYPDQKVVSKIPGSDEVFTVEKYKQEIGKPYSKIDLYICSDIDFQASLDDDTSDPVRRIDYLSPYYEQEREESQIDQIDASNTTIIKKSLDLDDDNSQICQGVKPCNVQQLHSTISLNDDVEEFLNNDFVFQTNYAGPSTSTSQKVFCPVCNKKFEVQEIQNHVDSCLQSKSSIFDDLNNVSIDDLNNEADPYHSSETNSELQPIIDRRSISLKLRLLIQNKAFNIDLDSQMSIEVRRNHCFGDFKKHFSKPWNKKKNHHIYSFVFHGDPGVDTGGISREFYDTALQEIKDQFFIGETESDVMGLVPNCGTVAVADGTIRSIGHLFSSSICNGGPGPGYLASWVFEFLTGGLKAVTENVPQEFPSMNSKYKSLYDQLSLVRTDEEVKTLLENDSSLDLLAEIGYRGNPAKATLKSKNEVMQSMFIKVVVEPFLPALTELSNGLECYNFLSVMKNNKDLFKPLFCPSEIFKWDYETFHDCLAPQYSEKGSTKNAIEIDVYKYFSDFIESLFMDVHAHTT